LRAPAVTNAQAARFVLDSAGITFHGNAHDQAVSSGWLRNTAANEPITMSALSFLIMSAFDMEGGLMYHFFPGPRYAFRSMVSRSYIQGASDPAMTLNGERFLLILGRVLSAEGE
jgi:hypothetical protein